MTVFIVILLMFLACWIVLPQVSLGEEDAPYAAGDALILWALCVAGVAAFLLWQ